MKKKHVTDNEILLSKYFSECSVLGEAFPKIIKAAMETKISTSTISRYARRRGYLSYEDMRACLIRENDTNAQVNREIGLLAFIEKARAENVEILVISSVSTETLALHIKTRLTHLGFKIRVADADLNNEFLKLKKNDYVLGITISMESARALKAIEYLQISKHKALIITTADVESSKYTSNVKFACLPELKSQDLMFSGFQAFRKLFDFIDDYINKIHLKWYNGEYKAQQ